MTLHVTHKQICHCLNCRYRAIIRKLPDKKKPGDDRQWLEIWNDSCRLRIFDLTASEQHEKVYNNDGQFGTLQWSYAETHLLYVAERKLPKTSSYFDKKPEADKCTGDAAVAGDEFVYRDNWGEQLSEKSHPVLCILDVESGGIRLAVKQKSA